MTTHTFCPKCGGMAFYGKHGARPIYRCCMNEKCGEKVQMRFDFGPSPLSTASERKEFLLRCRRNNLVRWMRKATRKLREADRPFYDNPFGLGSNPFNQASYGIAIVDHCLVEMGAEV